MKIPEIKEVATLGGKIAATTGGLVLGKTLQEVLMGTEILGRDKPLIPDNIATNAAGVAVGLAGAIAVGQLVKGESKEYLVMASLATGSYFLIRLINKATDSLSGLGDASENSLKSWLNKLVPRLEGLGNTLPTPSRAEVADFERMIQQYQPGAKVLPVSSELYGMSDAQVLSMLNVA